MSAPIGRWTASDNTALAKHQQLVDAVNENAVMDVDGEVEGFGTPNGRAVHDVRIPLFFVRRLGTIVTPATAYAADDPRYSVKVLQILDDNPDAVPTTEDNDGGFEPFPESGTPSDADDSGADDGGDVGAYIVATNWAEVTDPTTGTGTHKLTEDGTVQVMVFAFRDQGSPGNVHWFFSRSLGELPPGAPYQVLMIVDAFQTRAFDDLRLQV